MDQILFCGDKEVCPGRSPHLKEQIETKSGICGRIPYSETP